MSFHAPHASARPFVVGLTGGIATGKTTVSHLFAALGVPVIDLDQVARDVVAPGSALLTRVFERFGADLRRADGSLDRQALRRRVFADSRARVALEAMLHPAIQERAELLSAQAGGAAYQIVVNPLLVESGSAHRYDRVLVVECSDPQQRARLAARDRADAGEVEAMLAAQTTPEARRAVANDIIVNDSDLAALEHRVQELHRQYLGLAQRSSTITE